MSKPEKPPGAEMRATCPICGAPRHADYRPFCSKRCADVDLNRWLGGVYAVPAQPAAEEGDQSADAEPRDEGGG